MPSVIDKEKPIPLYYQIAAYIQDQIRNGRFLPDEKPPTEQWYCSFFGVSRMTVRRAFQELISSGLLERHRGQGPTVAPIRATRARTRLPGLSDLFAARGVQLTSRVLSLSKEPAHPGEADRLGVEEGTQLLFLRRLHHAEGKPAVLQNIYLRGELCGGPLRSSELKNSSLYALLEMRNIRIDHAMLRFASYTADVKQTEFLGVEPGTLLIYTECVSYLESGEILEFSRNWFPPSGFDIAMDIHR